jgi:hypothetical protein
MKRPVLRRLRRAQPNAAGIVLLLGFLLFSAPARATSEAVQTEQLPSADATGALTGCVNPNTGTSNGDWGIGTRPRIHSRQQYHSGRRGARLDRQHNLLDFPRDPARSIDPPGWSIYECP